MIHPYPDRVTFAHLVDLLTGAASLWVKFGGLTDQVRADHAAWREGRPAGIVLKLAISMFTGYLMWVIDGLVNHDWTVVVGQGFGVITTGILLTQTVVCARRIRHTQAVTPTAASTTAAASSRN